MTTSLFYLDKCFTARLFPGIMNMGTYGLYWRSMERTREYRWQGGEF